MVMSVAAPTTIQNATHSFRLLSVALNILDLPRKLVRPTLSFVVPPASVKAAGPGGPCLRAECFLAFVHEAPFLDHDL